MKSFVFINTLYIRQRPRDLENKEGIEILSLLCDAEYTIFLHTKIEWSNLQESHDTSEIKAQEIFLTWNCD